MLRFLFWLLDSRATLRRAALATLVANIGIVITGGLVRLTGSGLGCPTWPRCTDDSYVTTREMGFHGVIEFGNRTLTFLIGFIAAVALLAAWRQRKQVPGILAAAVWVLLGIGMQGVIGGITVHMELNPWIVATHFLASMVLIAIAYLFWYRTKEVPPAWTAPKAIRTGGVLITVVSAAVLVLGTIVTGSGPHSGDTRASRTGFDPAAMSQLHGDAVFVMVGLTVAMWLGLRALGAPLRVTRAAATLLAVELAQGVVGFVQYFTGLPWPVVILHMLGACLVWTSTLSLLLSLTPRRSGQAAEDRDHSLASTA
ncbi:COX15/CtaA family protein [Dactylosporangium sp. AC04546]|uniref:COX15/CtaA family protein n=1 Tax=Dactylosporangium sp. AC04546 TaxID=2862460 RepID=UPI001EE043A5|nr:COX15/CtaA family protein [Dactylosporangium sp. AC04546]WVK85612.1 COX15/CtaA family protein [Dactylosporangium sp. AC04546]